MFIIGHFTVAYILISLLVLSVFQSGMVVRDRHRPCSFRICQSSSGTLLTSSSQSFPTAFLTSCMMPAKAGGGTDIR